MELLPHIIISVILTIIILLILSMYLSEAQENERLENITINTSTWINTEKDRYKNVIKRQDELITEYIEQKNIYRGNIILLNKRIEDLEDEILFHEIHSDRMIEAFVEKDAKTGPMLIHVSDEVKKKMKIETEKLNKG